MTTDPTLSVIVTIVDGGQILADFMAATARFVNPPPLELILPYDDSIADVTALQADFPDAIFVPLGKVVPEHPITSQAGQHELFDRRRAAGLARATGDIIAILEDRGQPASDWARTAVRLHAETGKNVIGGAIDCREPASALNWAFYVSEFGRYGRPFASGPVGWVSDVNVTYSRQALEATRHLWHERFREPIVHWFLIGQGEQLLLSNELVVHHGRRPASFGQLLPERFHWGRLFGHIRAMKFTPTQRIIYILSSPLIPPLLWVRHFAIQRQKGRALRYLSVLPLLMILTTAWTVGEVWGAITRRP